MDSPKQQRPTTRRPFLAALKWLAVFVVTICIFFALLMPAIRAGRQRATRNYCPNALKAMGLALHNYHTVYGCFPPSYVADKDGKPIHSWRILLLPFLEHKDLYQCYDFSEPWNGPKNSLLAKKIPHEYRCLLAVGENPLATTYVAVIGDATAWPGNKCMRSQDIKDGASNTLMIVEVADSDINWMEPRDMSFDQAVVGVNVDKQTGISSNHGGGANVLFADGSVMYLPDSVSPATLKALLTIAGGETIEEDKNGNLVVRPP